MKSPWCGRTSWTAWPGPWSVNGPEPGTPFGGVRLLFFGDLHQLPPVVRPDEEELFRSYYASP